MAEMKPGQIPKALDRRGRNPHDVTPVYYRVQRSIQESIEKGTWKPYEVIPTEAEIAEIHKVSVGTVKKGILNLINEGYLYRVQGKGTFVAGTSLAKEQLRYYHFFKDFESEEARFHMRFLSLRTSTCPESVRHFLGIEAKNKVYKLERLHLCDSTPVIYSISRFPKEMFPTLEEFPRAHFESTPLYTIIEKEYGLPTVFNQELISATQADGHLANILAVKEGTPLLQIDMVSYTYKETPYEYRVSYSVTDQWKLFRTI
ncbi:MAG: GntR family transcriptional regulator [Candidatus Hydrogenedentota bacterium]|nr:MAG: GntR family transcriptional regulator [Candidatus Hydrogenedentota bacterium]